MDLERDKNKEDSIKKIRDYLFMRKSLQKSFFNFSGGLFLVLGIAGIILPLLPATPFLLASAYFFSKGSPEFHHWLLKHRYLGPPIKDWEERGVIRIQAKWAASIMLGISAAFIWPNFHIPLLGKLSFSILAVTVLVFVWSRPRS